MTGRRIKNLVDLLKAAEDLDAAYDRAADFDEARSKAAEGEEPAEEDEEDPNDYRGMGWVGDRGLP
jgi:hypothetical protein